MRPAFGRAFVGLSFIPILILLALVAVLGSGDTSTQAVKGGEGALDLSGATFDRPLPGMRQGANLCQAQLTFTNNPSTHFASFEDSVTPGVGDQDFTGRCFNSTTNAPSASPATATPFSIPQSHSNFASNLN